MKRLILILAVVCTVFIGCGSVGYAYSDGDIVNGITLTQTSFGNLGDYDNFVVTTSGSFWLVGNTKDLYINSIGYVNSVNDNPIPYASVRSDGTIASTGNMIGIGMKLEDFKETSFNIYDESGNVVFSPPPAPVVRGLEGITTELLMMILTELKPILLGLAVSVIGFLAFRKAWNWVLANCRAG